MVLVFKGLATLVGHTGWILSVDFSPDGLALASGSWDHTIRVWDVRSNRATMVLASPWPSVRAVAFSPVGAILASMSGYDAGQGGHLTLWDVLTGHEKYTVDLPGGGRCLAFSAKGTLVV